MLPKVQQALALFFVIFFINALFVAYNVTDHYIELGFMPAVHGNVIGIANIVIGFVGIIGMYVHSKQF